MKRYDGMCGFLCEWKCAWFTKPGLLVSRHLDRKPKVGQFDGGTFSLACQEKILWLEISVNDAVLVAVVDRLKDLLDAVRGIRFTVEFSSYDIFK